MAAIVRQPTADVGRRWHRGVAIAKDRKFRGAAAFLNGTDCKRVTSTCESGKFSLFLIDFMLENISDINNRQIIIIKAETGGEGMK